MEKSKTKIIRVAAVPQSLKVLLKGQLRFLNQHFEVIGVSSETEIFHEIPKQEGIKVIPTEIKRKISVIHDLKSLYNLYKIFKKEKPQIVHSITPKAGLLSMLAGKLAGVPIRMHTFTGLIFPHREGFTQKLLIFMDRILCKCATNLYPEGKGVKNDLIQFKITDKPLKILANGNINGIDFHFYDPKAVSNDEKKITTEKFNINLEDFVLIFIGRITKEKGVNELIESVIELKKSEIKNLKLLILGRYENDDPITEKTTKNIKENPWIIETGYQTDIRPFLAISDVFVFPSYREGFPNVVLQAGAMELPTVATNISGSNEIITDGFNGLIVEKKNSSELKDAILKTYRDNSLKEMGKNARKNVIEKYGHEIIWNAQLQEYQDLLESKNV